MSDTSDIDALCERLDRNGGWRDERHQCITDPALLSEAHATITALRDRLEKAKHAADGILAPVCAASGRYLYDWGDCPDMIKELHSEGVAIPAKAFRDLYDATDYEIAAQEPTLQQIKDTPA